MTPAGRNGGEQGLAGANPCAARPSAARPSAGVTTAPRRHFRKIPFFTLITSALQVVVFCVAEENLNTFLAYRSDSKKEIWRFVTYMLVHTNAVHLCLNVVIQSLLGTPLEFEQGRLRCAAVYFGGGTAGSLAASAFTTFTSMVGASGGVYALLVSQIPNVVLNYETIKYAPHRVAAVAALIASDVVHVFFHVYLSDNEKPRIGWVAHASGAAAGLLLGFLLFNGTSKWKEKFRVASCIILALPAVLAAGFFLSLSTVRPLSGHKVALNRRHGCITAKCQRNEDRDRRKKDASQWEGVLPSFFCFRLTSAECKAPCWRGTETLRDGDFSLLPDQRPLLIRNEKNGLFPK